MGLFCIYNISSMRFESIMGISDEFRKFKASLKNVNWSVSAINEKNELVVSLWGHRPLLKFDKDKRIQIYTDKITRWSGHGKNEFRKNLDNALKESLTVRAVLVKLKNVDDFSKILAGEDASYFAKNFTAKDGWIGKITLWDGENFTIEFEEDTNKFK